MPDPAPSPTPAPAAALPLDAPCERPLARGHARAQALVPPLGWSYIDASGLPVDVTSDAAVDAIMARLASRSRTRVDFVDADDVSTSRRAPADHTVGRHGDLVFAGDGNVRLAGRVLGAPIVEDVDGTDVLPRACERLAAIGHGVLLLGPWPGVAAKVRRWEPEREAQ